jgi:DNA-binding winged helix-turn-helix (wHTH) protein/TolB-like protein
LSLPPSETNCVYEFGPFRYDAGQRLLFRGETVVPLVPKAIDTLHVLVERHGRIVDKADLMKLVWPDVVVEEVGLARNISLLRKALEADGAEEAYIETIPRRGYRFIARVTEVDPAAGSAARLALPRRRPAWRWLIATALVAALAGFVYWQFYMPSRYVILAPGAPSLAVVPFECSASDSACGAVSEGFGELLVTDLAKLGGISVLAPSTVRRHRKMGNSMGLMGRLLGLDVLVEGSVQMTADRLRITARLVDVHTGKLIWADDYRCAVAECERIEDGVAQEIAAQVAAHLAIRQAFPHPGTPSR